MNRLSPLLLLAACATTPKSDYVPGGAGLPPEARVDYRRALYLEQSGEPERALAKLADLCSRHPTRLGFHLRRLRLERRLHGPEKAALVYATPPPGVDPKRAQILARLAATSEQDLADRADALYFAVENEPTEPFWHLALADVELAGHAPAAAVAEEARARGRVREAESVSARAGAFLDRATSIVEEALSLDPLLAEAHLLIGYICTRRADTATVPDDKRKWRRTAAERYGRALELDPESLPALLNHAENELYFNRYSNSVKDLRTAGRVAPGVPLVWSNLGSLYYRIGRLDEALEAYEKALRLDPKAARARTAYADCLQRRSRLADAVRELERAREDAGEDDKLQAEIAFKLGAIHEYERRYRRAVQEYELHIHHVKRVGESGAKARSRIRHIVKHAYTD